MKKNSKCKNLSILNINIKILSPNTSSLTKETIKFFELNKNFKTLEKKINMIVNNKTQKERNLSKKSNLIILNKLLFD